MVTQHSWNRNFLRLLENDEDLKALFDDTRALVGITDNDPTKKYQPGDLVWYSGHDPDGVPNIYLLVNLIPDNYGMPQGVSEKRFDRFGWKGKYQFKDMVEYGLSSILADKVDQEMSEHEEDENYHPLGRVSIDEGDDNYIGNKLLYKDLSNLDPKREENMFPDQVKWLPSHGAILNGCYRIYGNKIVEYDIIFKFGSDNEDQKNDSIFQSGSYIVANDVEIKPYSGVGEGYGRQDNVKYFKNTWDMDIFSHKNEEKKNYSQMGLLR